MDVKTAKHCLNTLYAARAHYARERERQMALKDEVNRYARHGHCLTTPEVRMRLRQIRREAEYAYDELERQVYAARY